MALSAPVVVEEGGSGTDSDTYDLPSVDTTDGNLLLLQVTSGALGIAETPSGISGLGLTWTLRHTEITGNDRVCTAIYTARADGSSGVLTIDFTSTMGNCSWNLYRSTSTGTPTVVQSAGIVTNSTTPEATFGTAPASDSLCMAFIAYNAGSGQTITTATGLTSIGTVQVRPSPSNSSWAGYDLTSPATTLGFGTTSSASKVVSIIEIEDVPSAAASAPILRSPVRGLTIR